LTDCAGGAERVAAIVANYCGRTLGMQVLYQVLSRRVSSSFSGLTLKNIEPMFLPFRSPLIGLLALPLLVFFHSFDLVFSTHVYTNAILSLLRRLRILRTQRLVTRESTTIFDRVSGGRRVIIRALYWLYGGQDLIVVQTRYMAEHLLPYLPVRARRIVQIVPNPVDLPSIQIASTLPLSNSDEIILSGRTNVLFCGRLVDVKQPLLALAAFRLMRDRLGTPVQLVILGDGPLLDEVQHEAEEMGGVVILGARYNPYQIMKACEFGLLTSSCEGFPNVILEMMAAGMKGIVMTPCCGDIETL
jgi:glycosyltransferase involved in cell wall biosynthesis